MREKTDPRNKAVYMRFTTEEYRLIEKRFKNTTCRKFSEYGRNILLEQPVTFNQRNASLDDLMTELIELRKQLSELTVRFDQSAEKLQFINRTDLPHEWVSGHESDRKAMLDHIRKIHEYISQTGQKWLQ